MRTESDHWLYLSLNHSLTDSLTNCRLVNLIDVTLACEDTNSKLVDIVTVADEDLAGNSLLQIWKLRFGQEAKLLSRLEHKVWSRFLSDPSPIIVYSCQ